MFSCPVRVHFVFLIVVAVGGLSVGDDVSFQRDVRPILSKHCFTCHGPDSEAREADLRLDTSAGAAMDLGGYQAVSPDDPETSELIARITSDDPDLRMPPADSHLPLSPAAIQILRSWIESGGQYETHWALTKPTRPTVPDVAEADWCRSPIDRFIKSTSEAAGGEHASQSEKRALLRRVTVDLTGTLPTPSQIDQFLADDDPKAYSRVVDRLLASPDYAETLARPWLDMARYSDTNGYEKDRPRTIWPYRDWVIDAINRDMPFDDFTIEQLAGDMLPGATDSQRIATGFHRNTMLNEEGGIDPLEYRFHALVDRVATTGTVWMGLTVGCAQCHTHKYDPITHTDYYSLMALMNGADEPEMVVQNDRDRQRRVELLDRRDQLVAQLAARHLPSRTEFSASFADQPVDDSTTAESAKDAAPNFADMFANFAQRQLDDSRNWITQIPIAIESTMPLLTVLDDDSILASGDVTKRDVYRLEFDLANTLDDNTDAAVSAIRLEALPDESLPAGGPGMAYYEGRKGDFFLSELRVSVDGQPVALRDASHSFGKISVGSGTADASNVIDDEGSTGWSTSGHEGKANRLVANLVVPVRSGSRMSVEMIFERHFAAALGRFRIALTTDNRDSVASTLPPAVDAWFSDSAAATSAIPPKVFSQLQQHFVMTADEFATIRRPVEAITKQLTDPPRTLVMKERKPAQRRETHRHHRGEYLQSKEQVGPRIPAVFSEPNSINTDHISPPVGNRLQLARWLVSESNPLGARVTVNRAWRHFFASGIVRTAGDFGTQSEPPSHPELLDWLATEWSNDGMSMKQLHRQIVMSATYRQSTTSGQKEAADPQLLTRFPGRRYEAERVRDTLLSASGLLVRQLGGPSVYPPQPASVTAMAYGNSKWPTSVGSDRFRRSLYTFSKRTAPFAAFTTFDAPTGELCIPRRDESTTPLQSLTLLNDEMYLEIAAGLADTAIRSAGHDADFDEIVNQMFVRLLSRPPSENELVDIKSFFESIRSRGDEEAWKLVARALINLDEAITTP